MNYKGLGKLKELIQGPKYIVPVPVGKKNAHQTGQYRGQQQKCYIM
jgi:hypothetical protein